MNSRQYWYKKPMFYTCLFDINKHCLFGFERLCFLFSFLTYPLHYAPEHHWHVSVHFRYHLYRIQNDFRPRTIYSHLPRGLEPHAERVSCHVQGSYDGRGPKSAFFATFSAGLLSFDSTWPREGNPLPEILSAAGFFYVGNSLIISVTNDKGSWVPLLRFIY